MIDTSGKIRTGLEFAPGTTPDCKRLVGRMFKPVDIISAYRTAREACGTGDIVLATSDQVGHIEYMSRLDYAKHLKNVFGDKASGFKMWTHSAHSIMKLPAESEAMWFVIDVAGMPTPAMCVIYATPYAVGDPAETVDPAEVLH